MSPRRWAIALPWLYIGLLTLGLATGLFLATPQPLDDHFNYQKFIETLAGGTLDLSIPGFHGSDFLAVPLYWITGSPVSQIHFLLLCAITLPALAYLAGKALYPEHKEWNGLALTTIISMMPFISFVGLRGWTGAGYFMLMLTTIWLSGTRHTTIAGISFGLAMLTKPFAIALLPLLLIQSQPPLPSTEGRGQGEGSAMTRMISRYRHVFIGLTIVAIYMTIQFFQAGGLIVGSHTDVTAISIWQGPTRILLNLAHALQILFSVHNYYFPDPALTGPGNMMHTTPVLIFLGIFGLFAAKDYFPRRSMALTLGIGALVGLGMNALLDHMDHFYMEASVLILILAALPVLRRHPLWIPLVIATLHFQWFYFYLQYRPGFHLDWWFFLVPAVVDLCFAAYMLIGWRKALMTKF